MLKLWFKRSFQVTVQGSMGRKSIERARVDMDVRDSLVKGLGITHGILEKSPKLKREAYIRFLWEIYLKIVKGRGTYKEDWNSMIREVQRKISIIKFNVVQLLSCVRLFATPWTAVHQASLSFTYPPQFTQSHVHWVDEV